MVYIYPAVFTPEKDGGYSVFFPDVPGAITQGETINEAITMAQDALCLVLYDKEVNGEKVHRPTPINEVKRKKNEFTTLIKCDTDFYRRYYANKSVKKTLSIPEWLNHEAMAQGLNFSAILQEGLKKHLKL